MGETADVVDGTFHAVRATFDGEEAALYVDGVRLQGTYSGTTGLQYTPDAHALRPSSFAFGHSPWSRPSLVTDAYIKANTLVLTQHI